MDKEIVEGNKLIAEFMGYKYFEANVHDDGGGRMDNVYSKVPIYIEVYDECKFFKSLPNPDFKKANPEKWNPEFGLLSWQTLNHDQFIYGVLEYHTSWDWLMPVVEKMCQIKCMWDNVEPHELDTYYPRTFGMLNAKTKKPMVRINSCPLFEADTLIKATWLAVIDFINWYNQNK